MFSPDLDSLLIHVLSRSSFLFIQA